MGTILRALLPGAVYKPLYSKGLYKGLTCVGSSGMLGSYAHGGSVRVLPYALAQGHDAQGSTHIEGGYIRGCI